MQNRSSNFKIVLKERSFKYAISIINFVDPLPKDASTKIITNQLLRSETSVGANITEAQAASSKKDFINFLNHALKSANESFYWLSLLMEAKRINNSKIHSLLSETQELAKILASCILTLKNKSRL